MKISDFFKDEFVDFASYDNLRKIASLVDGQKNAARKILFTVLEKNIKDKIKVSQLGSKVSEFSEYLHGNLDGVIVNLGQDFVGTNNIALIQKSGNFGTRYEPEASASRYIFASASKDFFELFKKEDIPILKHQTFEGHKIEPMFYTPTLPMLLVNGSEGVSSGFAQKILPRDPKQIVKYINSKLQGRNPSIKLEPWFRGFNGIVQQGDSSTQWLIKGNIKRIGINKVQITEVPVGYTLKAYLNVLDDLEDKKIIQGYKDRSENDEFLFDVNIQSKLLKELSDQELLQKLKLIKTVSENYTVIDENNKIAVFNSCYEILDAFIKVKLEYTQKRKDFLISSLKEQIQYDFSKYLFIKNIVTDELKINKRKKTDIVLDLEKIDKIIQKDSSYDYLLRLPIYNLTEEELHKLQEKIKNLKSELTELQKTPAQKLWENDLS